MKFWKMSGAGNDFVLIEARGSAALARRLCDRKNGIGADGLLAVDAGKSPRVRYWNADGSEAFCGNGTRCAALWLAREGRVKKRRFTLGTAQGPLEIALLGRERASVRMPDPSAVHIPREIESVKEKLEVLQIDTGVPHAVVFVRKLDAFRVVEHGRALRWHAAFAPAGANIDFVEPKGKKLFVRTYERGVEDETLACGTGVVAAALAAALLHGARSPVDVVVKSGDQLRARFKRSGAGFSDVALEGPGRVVFEGDIQ